MLSYVMVGASDIPLAKRFYSSFLPAMGYVCDEWRGKLIYSIPGTPDQHNGPSAFYVTPPFDGHPASVGNGTMIAFRLQKHGDVRELHAAALSSGGTDEGPPGFRADYGERFYVGYLRDPQGNKIALFCTNPDEPTRRD
jgi:catechol 2,3-dioxygenase-like lactoylglutathione lyase family enzyme